MSVHLLRNSFSVAPFKQLDSVEDANFHFENSETIARFPKFSNDN